MTQIFEELHKLADKRGITLTEAADEAGIPRSTLWGWRNRLPKTLQALERIMGVLKSDRTRSTPTEDENKPVREGGDKPA